MTVPLDITTATPAVADLQTALSRLAERAEARGLEGADDLADVEVAEGCARMLEDELDRLAMHLTEANDDLLERESDRGRPGDV